MWLYVKLFNQAVGEKVAFLIHTFTIYGLSNNIKLQPTFLCGAGKLIELKKKYLNKNKIALNVIELKKPEDLEKKSAFLEVVLICDESIE